MRRQAPQRAARVEIMSDTAKQRSERVDYVRKGGGEFMCGRARLCASLRDYDRKGLSMSGTDGFIDRRCIDPKNTITRRYKDCVQVPLETLQRLLCLESEIFQCLIETVNKVTFFPFAQS